jgi:hypothetical protein
MTVTTNVDGSGLAPKEGQVISQLLCLEGFIEELNTLVYNLSDRLMNISYCPPEPTCEAPKGAEPPSLCDIARRVYDSKEQIIRLLGRVRDLQDHLEN